MSLPGVDSVARFQANEARLNLFINGSENYIDSNGNPVESVPHLVNTLGAMTLTVVNKGDWVVSTVYNRNDIVKSSGIVYICVVAHTSGVFATDLSNGKWLLYGLMTQTNPVINGSILVNASSAPGTENNTMYLKGLVNTGANAGRAMNVEGHYAGTYASTCVQFSAYTEGVSNQDHMYSVQSWCYGNNSATVSKVASYMAAATQNTGTWTNYYGFLYSSANINGGTIGQKWAFFGDSPDPSYLSGKLAISGPRLTESQIMYDFFVNASYVKGTYGVTKAQAGIFGTDAAAIDKGGCLVLGGKSGLTNDPYPNAFLLGGRESLTTYAGYFSISTASGGDNAGESNSANYERIRVPSVGGLQILTVGKSLGIKEGTNAKMGLSTLVAGSVVVSTTAVAAGSRIMLTPQSPGGTPGWVRISARTAGTSFTITSSSGSDTSTVAWVILDSL